MRIALNSLLLISGLLLVPLFSSAQKKSNQDFIELRSGEILNGQVLIYGGKKKYTEVTIIQDGQSTNYLPSQVNAVGYGNNLRFEVDDRTNTFWLALIKGEMSVYKNAQAYFLKNSDGEIFVLNDKVKPATKEGVKLRKKNNVWRRELAKATNDCPNQIGLVQLTKFNDQSITEYVKFYNDCKDSKSEIYTSDRNQLTARFGISAAGFTMNSQAKPRNLPLLDEAEGASSNFEFGIASEIYFKNSLERITFTPALNYRNINVLMTSSQLRPNGGPADVHHDVYYKASLISAPFEVKFALNRSSPRIYVKAAFILDYSISTEIEAYQELESSASEVSISASEIDVLPELFTGYGGSIGSQFQLGNLKANIEANYQITTTSDLNPIFSINHQRIGVGIKVFL